MTLQEVDADMKMSPEPPVEWSSEMDEIEIPTSLSLNEIFTHLLRRCALAAVRFQTDGNDAVLLTFAEVSPPPLPLTE